MQDAMKRGTSLIKTVYS